MLQLNIIHLFCGTLRDIYSYCIIGQRARYGHDVMKKLLFLGKCVPQMSFFVAPFVLFIFLHVH